MKRIFLFLVTNLAVMLVLSIVIKVLGLDRMLAADGINYGGLLVFSAVVGFTGAIISLLMSKTMAKWSTGAHIIDTPRNEAETWLVQTVKRLADKAGIGMPEVAVYEGEPNAFATGAFRNSALVAVSTGLLNSMTHEEIEAVLGHEVAHVANGDMVTLTLVQGVVNTFVIFLSRVIGGLLSRSDDGRGGGYFVTVIVLQLVFGILANMIVMWFSRHREFRADRGGAQLAGRENMIGALEDLKKVHEPLPSQQFAAFGIAEGPVGGGIKRLFMSHPPLDERIAALRALNIT
jgi:heat shock protein HtpX